MRSSGSIARSSFTKLHQFKFSFYRHLHNYNSSLRRLPVAASCSIAGSTIEAEKSKASHLDSPGRKRTVDRISSIPERQRARLTTGESLLIATYDRTSRPNSRFLPVHTGRRLINFLIVKDRYTSYK